MYLKPILLSYFFAGKLCLAGELNKYYRSSEPYTLRILYKRSMRLGAFDGK